MMSAHIIQILVVWGIVGAFLFIVWVLDSHTHNLKDGVYSKPEQVWPHTLLLMLFGPIIWVVLLWFIVHTLGGRR